MAGSSAVAVTAKPNGAGAGGQVLSFQLAGRRRLASLPSFQLHESKSFIAPMNTYLTMALAVAVLVVPLACAYAIVVRLARRRTRSD
jgi:hypothetical protein